MSDLKTSIIFTDSAAKKVLSLIQEEDNFKLNLRVFVTGGGCSGFQYGFTFDEQINADDTVVVKEVIDGAAELEDSKTYPVKLLVDSLSFQYLIGAEIDYKNDVNGEQFIIRNPNANTTCGCGSSFSV